MTETKIPTDEEILDAHFQELTGKEHYRVPHDINIFSLLKKIRAAGLAEGAREQREMDADKIYRRAIELVHRDSHVGVALVDMSETIRKGGLGRLWDNDVTERMEFMMGKPFVIESQAAEDSEPNMTPEEFEERMAAISGVNPMLQGLPESGFVQLHYGGQIPVVFDRDLEPNTIELRNKNGQIVRIVNLGGEGQKGGQNGED